MTLLPMTSQWYVLRRVGSLLRQLELTAVSAQQKNTAEIAEIQAELEQAKALAQENESRARSAEEAAAALQERFKEEV